MSTGRSPEEILADIHRIFEEGERVGAIHFNPPRKHYLADVAPPRQRPPQFQKPSNPESPEGLEGEPR